MDGRQVFLQCQVDEVVGGGSALSVQLRDLLHQAKGSKPSGKVGCRENQLLPVQYTVIGHSAQVPELLVHICREVTEGGDLQLLFVVHWVC